MEQTLHFLFLRFQLSFHVRERGLDLLKVLVRFGVCGIKVLMLPLFLSAEVLVSEISEERGDTRSEGSLT